jgi:prenyltransferase beta subunit
MFPPLLRCAARASAVLPADAVAGIQQFLLGRQSPSGGFLNRAGEPDLYYTFFALAGLLALGTPVTSNQTQTYLAEFGTGKNLDFVALASLLRSRASLRLAGATKMPTADDRAILDRLECYRAADGGYHHAHQSAAQSTLYGTHLVREVYSDLKLEPPLADNLPLARFRARDGGYSNQTGMPQGTTPATASAAMLVGAINPAAAAEIVDWLLARASEHGGFLAAPHAPMPDLLSTATALYALRNLQVGIKPELAETCQNFIETLWQDDGGFSGHLVDTVTDCEYTFYAVLAIACLGGPAGD